MLERQPPVPKSGIAAHADIALLAFPRSLQEKDEPRRRKAPPKRPVSTLRAIRRKQLQERAKLLSLLTSGRLQLRHAVHYLSGRATGARCRKMLIHPRLPHGLSFSSNGSCLCAVQIKTDRQ